MKNMFIKSLLLSSFALTLNADFIRDEAQKVVNDTKTGLMWQDDTVRSNMNWADAISTCKDLTLGGYSDWRLPNIEELKSIVDKHKAKLALPSAFSSSASSGYWSSSTDAGNTSFAYGVFFTDGGNFSFVKTEKGYVRCVRTGQ